ncbi:MAG: glycosyltransferase [Bacteroidota bacterium]|nr:glycosyltransferase [Bacteroidota bacterium]
MSTANKKLKVLFISSWYPNRNNLSHGIFIKRHAEATSLLHQISVIHACADKNIKKGTFETEETLENNVLSVVVYYKKVNSLLPVISSIIKLYRYINAHFIAYKCIEKQMGKPEILHLQVIYKAGLIALIFHKLFKIPLIISEHWSGYMPEDGNYKGFLKKLITRLSVKKAKSIIVVSEKMKENMLRHKLYNQYTNIYNVVDEKLFKPALFPKEKENNKIHMIHVSSLNEKEKNISGILRTIKKLSGSRDDFQLEFIGESDEKFQLEKMASEMGILNNYVFFKGWKSPGETAELMRKSDFFLMFSNYEGLPCVLIESLASGIPVIATNTGGIPEIITKEQGLLVTVKDEDELFKTINEMLDNYKNYNSKELSNYAKENFSYEKVAEKISTIYQTVIKHNNGTLKN